MNMEYAILKHNIIQRDGLEVGSYPVKFQFSGIYCFSFVYS